MDINNAELFENCVSKIFKEAEYSVTQNIIHNNYWGEIDIVAEKNDVRYCVEVKYSMLSDKAAARIVDIAQECKMSPILVVSKYINSEKRGYLQEKYSNLILIDISNLLFAVRYNDELRNELIASLNYSVDNIEPTKGFIEINVLQHSAYTNL